MQDKFIVGERAPKIAFKLQSLDSDVVKAGIVKRDTPTTERFCAVHGKISVAQQGFRRFFRADIGHADAGAGIDFLAIDQYRRPQCLDQQFSDLHRILRTVEFLEQHGEFVATEPSERVSCGILLQNQFQTLRDLDQQTVARSMTEAVVDKLETVEINEENGKMFTGNSFCAG